MSLKPPEFEIAKIQKKVKNRKKVLDIIQIGGRL